MKQGCILYDLDGTLVDSRDDLTAAVNAVRSESGLGPTDVATVCRCVGEGMRSLAAGAVPERSREVDAVVAGIARFYGAHLLDATVLYPGVAEALARFHAAGFVQAVVTNKAREFTLPILKGLGVEQYFPVMIGGGDPVPLKPDPAPLRMAMERLGWDPSRGPTWMVGDHYTDLESGRRAGLRRCFCRYGFGDPRQETWDLAVQNLDELARHVTSA